MQQKGRDAQRLSPLKTPKRRSYDRRFGVFNTLIAAAKQLKVLTSTALSRKAILVMAILLVPGGVLLTAFNSGTATAAPSNYLNFQARLLTNTGNLVPDGTYNIEFKLYKSSASGASLQGVCVGGVTDDCEWLETRTSGNKVSVTNGYFSVNLASVTGFGSSIDWSSQHWLTMNIGGTGSPSWDGEMSPRILLTAVPLAFVANNVASGNTSASSTNSSNISIKSGNATGTTSNSGSITLDTGTATGTTGTISLGASNASSLILGRSGLTTLNSGALNVGENFTVDTSTLFVDSTSNRVGIGTLSPQGTGGDLTVNRTASGGLEGAVNFGDSTGARILYTSGIFDINGSLYVNKGGLVETTISNGTGALELGIAGAAGNFSDVALINDAILRSNNTNLLLTVKNNTGNIYLTTGSSDTSKLTILNNGDATFAGNLVVSAGKALTITGGNTASRPGTTTCTTEGMLYYDTTTHQLLVCSATGGKWQADRSTATKIVATATSSQASRDAADYIGNGNTGSANDGDQVEINAAISALPAGGGVVYLLEGTYIIDNSIIIPSNVTLVGSGDATAITLPSSFSTSIDMITNSNTSSGNDNIRVKDMLIDGTNGTGGTQNGIKFVKVGVAATNRGAIIEAISATGMRSYPIELDTSYNGQIKGNKIYGTTSGYGISITGSSFTLITNNILIGTGSGGGEIDVVNGSSNTISNNTLNLTGDGVVVNNSDNTTVSGNNITSPVARGVTIQLSDYANVTGNTVNGTGFNEGILILSATHSIVNSNTIRDTSTHGINVTSSTNNLVDGNFIYNIGTTGSSNSINVTDWDNRITNNWIEDTAGTGYAIAITAGTGNYLAGNHFEGTGATAISDAGTNTVFGGQAMTTDGDVRFRAANSGTAFSIQNASGVSILNADTSTNVFTIGTSDTTGTLLVLDTKTGSGDPTGVAGGMYYNSNAGKFRCYQGAAWTDCIGSSGTYLAKNSADTSSAAITATNYLYGFTNSSSAVASGVLKLDNGNNTGIGLLSTATAGTLLSLQNSASTIFSVSANRNAAYNAGSAGQLAVTSDLSLGARSSAVIDITQADNATNNSTAALLSVTNADALSTNSVVLFDQQATGGLALSVSSAGVGVQVGGAYTIGVDILAPVNTTGIRINSNITSGAGLVVGSGSPGNTAFTGKLVDLTPGTRTVSSGTVTDTGNFLKVARSNATSGSATLNVTGSLASLSSICSAPSGTCNDSSNLINLTQSYASASGALIQTSNVGLGSTGVFTLANTSGTQTSGLTIDRNASGGTTTSLLSLSNTLGTVTNGILFTGTIGTDINTASGRALTIQGSNGITASTSNGTSSGAIGISTGNASVGTSGALTVSTGTGATSSGVLTIKTGDSATGDAGNIIIDNGSGSNSVINIGTVNSRGISIGNANGTMGIGILSGTGNIVLQVAGVGTTGYVQIGGGGPFGGTTPDFLALDVKSTTGDPSGGDEGYMYYNTFDNKFRCYQGAAWTDCIGSGGSASPLQGAYDADANGSDARIDLTSTDGSLIFSNPSSGGSTSSYVATVEQLATGSVGGLSIQSAGTGNLLLITDTTATARDVLKVADGGAVTLRNQTDSTAALEVQSSSTGTGVLTVDTTNSQVIARGINGQAVYGSDLRTGNCSGANWSGTGAGPYTHSSGPGLDLNCSITGGVTAGESYYITFDTTGMNSSDFVGASVGGNFGMSSFGNQTSFTVKIQATTTTNPIFSLSSTTSTGSITNITIQHITSMANSVLTVQNSDGTTGIEVRSGGSGLDNTFIGFRSGESNDIGVRNTSLGTYALQANSDGTDNTAVGGGALGSNTHGYENTALGTSSLSNNVIGNDNTAVGESALWLLTSGDGNTSLGRHSGGAIFSGNYNTYVGASAGWQDADAFMTTATNNATVIGAFAQATANSSLILGGAGSDAVNVGIGTPSPTNIFSVSPTQYNGAGLVLTASQSGTTVTGTGTTFTSAMVGSEIVWADGHKAIITAFANGTTITATPSQTVVDQAFRIHYPGLQVTSAGNVGVGTTTPSAKLEVAAYGLTTDYAQIININDVSTLTTGGALSVVGPTGAANLTGGSGLLRVAATGAFTTSAGVGGLLQLSTATVTGTAASIVGTGVMTTTGNLLTLSAVNATTTTGLLTVNANQLTSGYAANINVNGTNILTTGGALNIVGPTGAGINLTGGSGLLRVASAGTFTSTAGVGGLLQVSTVTVTGTAASIVGTGVMTTTGNLLTVTGNSATTATGLFTINGSALTSGYAQNINVNGAAVLTSGGAINIVGPTGAATISNNSGLVKISAAGAFTTTAGSGGLLDLQANAVITGTLASISDTAIMTTTGSLLTLTANAATSATGLLKVSATGLTSGYAQTIDVGSVSTLTTGGALNILGPSGAANLTSGSGLLRIVGSGAFTTTAATGGLLQISGGTATGTIASIIGSGTMTTTGNLLTLTAASATTATGLLTVNGAALTSGYAANINVNGATALTTGGALNIVGPTGAATMTSGNGLLRVSSAGAFTTTAGAGGLLQVVGNATTAGTIASVSGTALTTGVALQVTGNSSTASTTASALAVTGGRTTITPTVNITAAAGSVWDGLDITATTATLTGSTGVATATGFNFVSIRTPTITDASAVTVTNSASLYIAAAPFAAGSVTITNPYALWIDSGAVRLDGTGAGGGISVALGATASTNAVCSSLANTTAPTAGTAYELRDCNAAPAADYAEMYPAASNVDVGDVVSQGSLQVPTYNWSASTSEVDWNSEKGSISQVVKSTTAYDHKLVGVVSDNYLDFVSTGYNIKQSDNPKSIALNGRVNVKITNENGDIEPGDFLTASATRPGYAMKATQAGYVIGQALSGYTSSNPGLVMVFVRGQYYPGPQLATMMDGNYANMNVTGSLSTLNLQVTGAATIVDLTVTNQATIQTLTVTGDALFEGNLSVQGLLTTKDLVVTGEATVKQIRITDGITLGDTNEDPTITEVAHPISKRFKASKAIAAGSVVVLDVNAGNGWVTTTTTLGSKLVIGVAISAAANAGDNIEVAIGGTVKVTVQGSGITIGDMLHTDAQEGKAAAVAAPITGELIGKVIGVIDGNSQVLMLVTLQ